MSKLERLGNTTGRIFRSNSLWISIALIIGLLAGNYVFSATLTRPAIGLITVNCEIYPFTSPDIVKMIDYAANTSSIKAVVINLDCPGGESVSTEELYLHLTSLRSKKPVVTYIDTVGASGGYYMSVASNYIIAKPSSTVGSVGAYTTLPYIEEVEEDMIWTGPYKRTGSSRKEAMDRLESLKTVFLQTVVTERGDRLKISSEEVSKAGIYSGLQAYKYGIIDQIGSSEDAYLKAAELAGIRGYSVVNIAKELGIRLQPWWYASTGMMTSDNLTLEKSGAPAFFYLYRQPEIQR